VCLDRRVRRCPRAGLVDGEHEPPDDEQAGDRHPRLPIEALNARDVAGVARHFSDEVEFRNALGGCSLGGREALAGSSEIRGTAIFEVRDGRITAFEISPERLRR
jgi:hypothetical protein